LTVEALPAVIRDARKRQRRRRLGLAAVLLAAVAAVVAPLQPWQSSGRAGKQSVRTSTRRPPVKPTPTVGDTSELVVMIAASERPVFQGAPALLRRPRTSADVVPGWLVRQA
jgi:hypothetical protein